jgi:hypothetical protein
MLSRHLLRVILIILKVKNAMSNAIRTTMSSTTRTVTAKDLIATAKLSGVFPLNENPTTIVLEGGTREEE